MPTSLSARKTTTLVIAFVMAVVVACAMSFTSLTPSADAATTASVSMSKSSSNVTKVKITKKVSTSGTISYKLYSSSSKYAYAKNGKYTSSTKPAVALSVSLSGTVAKKYYVWYRVKISGYGWLSWVRGGTKTGTSVSGKYIQDIEVKILKKSSTVNMYANAKYITKANFFKLSGSAYVDSKIVGVAAENKSLKTAFKWVVQNIKYDATAGSGTVAEGTLSADRLKSEAYKAFVNKKGDCYTFTAATYYLAEYLGWNAQAVSGWQKSKIKAKDADGNYIKDADGNYVYEKEDDGVTYKYNYSAFSWATVLPSAEGSQYRIYDAVNQQLNDKTFANTDTIKCYDITYDYMTSHEEGVKTPQLTPTKPVATSAE